MEHLYYGLGMLGFALTVWYLVTGMAVDAEDDSDLIELEIISDK